MPKGFNITNTTDTAKISIVGEINWAQNNSDEFTQKVDALLEAGVQNVEGYINTPGGSMVIANEIGNQIQRFPGTKKVVLGAICASAGTYLSLYFDHDKIYAHKNINYMIHLPEMIAKISKVSDFDSQKTYYNNLLSDVKNRYVEKTGLSDSEITDMMEKTTWMNAQTLKSKGFISKIIDREDRQVSADTVKVLNHYGLTIPEAVNSLIKQTETSNKPKIEMNKFLAQIIMAFQLQGVTSESSETEVLNALSEAFKNKGMEATNSATELATVKNQLTQKDTEIAQLKEKVESHNKAKVTALLDMAENDQQKITNAERVEYEKIAESSEDGFNTIKNLLELRPAKQSLIDRVQTASNKASGNAPKDVKSAVYNILASMPEA